jgi:hypothetical protein
MPKYSAPHGKQTGSKNTKAIGGKQKKTTIVDPWGPIVPNRRVGKTNGIGQSSRARMNTTGGSAARKPTPDPALKSMNYPKNDPLQWPVEIDTVNHTRQPSVSGVTSTVVTNVNQSIENAYTRAKYQ